MSKSYNAVPPPGVANLTSLGNGMPIRSDMQFAKPMLPPPRHGSASTAPLTKKRKSRFSDAPPSSEAPPPKVLQVIPSGISDSQKAGDLHADSKKAALVSAAAAAAARINANLLAQGKIKSLSTDSQLTSPSTAPTSSISSDIDNPALSAEIKRIDDMYSTEVEINDIPVGCRNYLTRLTTQENINKSCFAYVSTRGKYMSAEEKKQSQWLTANDKPLYLFVQSQQENNVKKALDRIKQIINNHYEKKSKFQSEALAQIASLNQKSSTMSSGAVPNPMMQGMTSAYSHMSQPVAPLPHFQPALPSGNYMQEKLFVGLDNVPEHFDLKNKLIGPNYRNFTFIANQTGAKVILRGKGSGFLEPTSGREAFESMYAFISHPNQAGVEAAKRLVSNLIETVKTELGPLSQINQPPQQSSGYGHLQSNYQMVPPPPMPVQSPSAQPVSNPYTAYPFQQNAMIPPPPPSEPDQDTNVLGYQHNFAGTEKNNSRSSKGSKSREKSKKRFTEELEPTSQQTNIEVQSATQPSNVIASESNFKKPSLPFWMTP